MMLALLAGAFLRPAFAETWWHARSPHFEMFSSSSKRESQEMLSSLELFRHMFVQTMGVGITRSPRTTVILFKRDRDFDAYKPIRNGKPASMGGVCLNHPDATYIALSSEHDADFVRHLIQHEYVHQLVGAAGMDAPPWLNEGLAEVFGTLEVRGDSVIIGKAPPYHAAILTTEGLMPMSRLLAVTHGSPEYTERTKQGTFYAQSWALVHYTLFAKQDVVPRGGIDEFCRLVAQSPEMPVEAAFVDTFKVDFDGMERLLSSYCKRGQYFAMKTPLPETWPGKDNVFEKADPLALELALLQLKARLRRDPAAAYEVRQVQQRHPADPRPYEVLGVIAQLNQDADLARDHWAQAEAHDSDNVYAYLAGVERDLEPWLRGVQLQQSIPPAMAALQRTRLERILALDPDDQRAVYWLAWLESFAAEPSLANANLVQQRVGTHRQKQEILMALAVMRWRFGDKATAEQITRLLVQHPPPARRRILRALAAEMDIPWPEDLAEKDSPRQGPPMRLQVGSP